PCAPSTSPAGSATQSVPRKPTRNSGTPPRPSRPSPGNRRSPYSRPASHNPRPQPEPARKEKPPRPPGPRTVEPRAFPATTRGIKPCPHSGSGTTKPDSKTDTEHESGNNPERRKHLKSVVLDPGPQRWPDLRQGR